MDPLPRFCANFWIELESDPQFITYGVTMHASLAAAEEMARENIEVEVIDLRSIQPWDEGKLTSR